MKTKNVTEKNMKVCLVGSSGGHLTHLYIDKNAALAWMNDFAEEKKKPASAGTLTSFRVTG